MLRDKKYLIALRECPCLFCGSEDGTVCGHHIRTGTDGGTGLKPSDYYAVPLCYRHHTGEENIHGIERSKFREYGFTEEPKEIAKQLYERYKQNENLERYKRI